MINSVERLRDVEKAGMYAATLVHGAVNVFKNGEKLPPRSSVLVRNQTAHLESRLASESSPATACAQSARKPLRHLVTVLLGGSFVGHSVLLCFCKSAQSVQFSNFEERCLFAETD